LSEAHTVRILPATAFTIRAGVDTFQWKVSLATTTSGLFEKFVEGVTEVAPLATTLLEFAPTAGGQVVVASLPTLRWSLPLASHQTAPLQVVQDAVRRAFAPTNQMIR
jgi:hypothetical protein